MRVVRVDREEGDEEDVMERHRQAEHVDQPAHRRQAEEDQFVPEHAELGQLVVVVFDLLRIVDEYHELGDDLAVQREDRVDVGEAESVVFDPVDVEAASDLSFTYAYIDVFSFVDAPGWLREEHHQDAAEYQEDPDRSKPLVERPVELVLAFLQI